MNVSLIPTTRIDKDHPKDHIIRDLNSSIQTRRMTKMSDEYAMEPKKAIQALEDPSWVEAMQEELLQFKLLKLVKTASTPIETNKALVKDEEAEAVDVNLYRSMIGSLMYLTTFRPDIMFAVCACARDSTFDLEAFSDSDYAGAILDIKSTTGVMSQIPKQIKRGQDTKIPQSSGPLEKVGDEAVHKELGDRMERAATTASSL
ncbi:hypothetical protein Tco_1449429 [Tanacetum coccineum]